MPEVKHTIKRIEYLDLAKGICMVTVVLHHITLYYDVHLAIDKYFKLINVPLFFFLSGVFFKTYGGFLDFVKRKTNSLMIPFVFWYLLLSVGLPLVAFHLFGIMMRRVEHFTLLSALPEFWIRENFPNVAIWFLLSLFWMNIVFFVINWVASCLKSRDVFVIVSLSMILGVAGLILGVLRINLPAYLDTSLSALPFFCFGYLAKNHTEILVPNNYDKYLLWMSLALFLMVGVMAILFGETFSMRKNLFTLYSAMIAYPCGWLGTLAVILFTKKVKKIPLVSLIGRYSIMILVTHMALLEFYAMLFRYIGVADNLGVYINLAVTLLSYLVLIPFMKRFMPYVTAQKDVIKV